MNVFDDDEREYLLSGVRLGRLATVGPDGTHVVPTGFRYNNTLDTIATEATTSPSARSAGT